MSLQSTASDVLGMISDFTDARSLISLFLAGNRILNLKLGTGKAVTHLKIDVGQVEVGSEPCILQNPFPQLKRLSQLTLLFYYPSLSDLYLDFSRTVVVFDGIDSLQHLPLRRLCLKMADTWQFLINPETRVVQPLQSLFPNLDTLIIKDTKGINGSTCTQAEWEQVARQLPQTLTHLELGIVESFLPPFFGNLLPPLVHTFLLETNATFSKGFEPFPESLTALSLVRRLGLSSSDTAVLPPSLTSLSVTMPIPNQHRGGWYYGDADIIGELPRTLKTLHIQMSGFGSDIFALLPPQLTVLDMPALDSISTEHVQYLPRTLEVLKVKNGSADCFEKLPPTLTVLHCAFHFDSGRHWKIIPSSLKEFHHINLGVDLKIPKNVILPEKIESISFRLPVVPFGAFPRKLKHLELVAVVDHLVAFELVPPTLVSLSLAYLPHSCTTLHWLPKGLERLKILRTEHFLTRMLAKLPSTLRSLYLGPGCDSITMTHLQVLPPHMDDIYINVITIDETVLDSPFAEGLETISIDSLISLAEAFFPSCLTSRICDQWVIPGAHDLSFFGKLHQLPRLKSIDWSLTVRHHPTYVWVDYRPEKYCPIVTQSFFAGSVGIPFADLTRLVCNLSAHIPSFCNFDLAANLSSQVLTQLPPNLTELECNFPVNECQLKDLRLLRVLNLPRFSPSVEFYDTIPSTLEKLGLNSATLMLEAWPKLPRNLTSLAVSALHFFKSTHKELPPFDQLPPLMTELTLCAGSELKLEGPCTSWLRPGVSHMALGTGTQALFQAWTASNIAQGGKLPDSVTDVFLAQIPANAHANVFSRFPSNVTRVSMPTNYHVTSESIELWPESLTSIQLGGFKFSKKDLAGLNANETVLDWTTLKSIILLRAPKNLTDITVENRSEFASPDWAAELPKELKVIDLEAAQLSDASVALLPRSLEVLRLVGARRLTSQCLKSMPPSLKELALISIDMKSATFPSTLTRLELSTCPSFTSEHVENLPSTLLHLSVPGSTITEGCLMKTNLKSLHVRQIRLTPGVLQDCAILTLPSLIPALVNVLPTSLESLQVNEIIFDPEAILSALPQSITHVDLPSPNVKTIKSTIMGDDSFETVYRRSVNRLVRPLHSTAGPVSSVSLAPATSLHPSRGTYSLVSATQSTQTERWLEFELLLPSEYKKLFHGGSSAGTTSSASKDSIVVVWVLSNLAVSPTKKFPEKLETFHCDHLTNWEHLTLKNLPKGLLSLKLPHSRRVTGTSLIYLPESLTSLHVNPTVMQYLKPVGPTGGPYAARPFPVDPTILPPNLTQLTLCGTKFSGSQTSQLHFKLPTYQYYRP